MKNKIKQIRQSFGLSQDALAQKAGVSRPFLSTIETGTAIPTVKNAMKIAGVLGCTVDELFAPDEEDSRPSS